MPFWSFFFFACLLFHHFHRPQYHPPSTTHQDIVFHLFCFTSLIHPLSPRGKLVPLGLEGLASTNELLRQAVRYQPDCILREEIFRIALTDEHVTTLQETAKEFPDWSEWIDQEDLPLSLQRIEPERNQDEETTTSTPGSGPRGALRLFSGCQVINVPTYLKGLWSACLATVAKGDKKSTTTMTAQWLVEPELTTPGYNWKQRLSEYDTVVFAAGAGLFQDPLSSTLTNKNSSLKTRSLLNLQDFPVTLVRGQSMELTMPQNEKTKHMGLLDHAILCGKYVSPLFAKDKVLIGATHEFQSLPLSRDKVEVELKERSYAFASQIWDSVEANPEADRVITSGVRVQSNRGKFGRMPMIGRYDGYDKAMDVHPDAWIFTGLSSRGLLYHGVLGDILTDQMLQRDGIRYNSDIVAHLNWWKQRNPLQS
jgi:glycine/D-amino acid oxidase-like deaminating enzyme